MNIRIWIGNIAIVSTILFALTLTGSVVIDHQNVSNPFALILFIIVSLVVAAIELNIIGTILVKGIRSVKKPFGLAVLAHYFSVFLCGYMIAFLTPLSFPYSVHLNLSWLGTQWLAQLLTMILVGSPILLVFMIRPNDISPAEINK
jgi:hypothetical protein